MVTRQSHELIRLHGHYKNGVMPWGKEPYGPGLYEQPAAFAEAMELIDSAITSELKK